MLERIVESVLTMSLYGSLVGLVALLLSRTLNHIRAPKGAALVLWALAALRLMCPLDLSSSLSVFNVAPQVQAQQLGSGYAGDYETALQGTPEYERAVAAGAPVRVVATSAGQRQTAYYYEAPSGAMAPARTLRQTAAPVLTAVWAVGAGCFLIWGVVSYGLLRRRLRFAMRVSDEIYEVDTIPSPCVAGFAKPKVYLPVGLTELQQRHTIAHERCHIQHRDHIWKLLSYLVLAVHWFNPLVWVFYRRFQQDLEMACDERVLQVLGTGARADYSESLLTLAKKQRAVVPSPIAFSENTTRERITKILRYKKPLAAVTAVVLMMSIALAGILATGPVKAAEPADPAVPETEPVYSTAPESTEFAGTAETASPLTATVRQTPDAELATELFEVQSSMEISLYVAGADVYGNTYAMTEDWYAERLGRFLEDCSWDRLDAPEGEPQCSWLRYASPDGSKALTYYSEGVLCWQDGAQKTYWQMTPGQDLPEVWKTLRGDYDELDLDLESIAISASDAREAAAQFATTEYGEAMLNRAPEGWYNITDYKAVEWGVREISADGRGVVAYVELAVLPVDMETTRLWIGNGRGGEGEYEGWLVMYMEYSLQLQADGLWHNVSLGTGGVTLP